MAVIKLFEAVLDALQKNKIKMMAEGFVFFFIFQNEVYGANEPSRVTFAKMKDPKDEDGSNPGWLKESNFQAVSLTKLGKGIQVQTLFTSKDLPKIEVISKEEAISQLERFFEKEKDAKQ